MVFISSTYLPGDHSRSGQVPESLPKKEPLEILPPFNGHFPGEPGLAMSIEAKDDRDGGDNWTTGAINRAKLQSNHHHQHPVLYGSDALPVTKPTTSKY